MFKLLFLYSESRTQGQVEFLRRETPAFIPPDRWPANSLDLSTSTLSTTAFRAMYSIMYTRSR